MRTSQAALVQLLLIGLSLPAAAQGVTTTGTVLEMPRPAKPATVAEVPQRGLTMAQVTARYGNPLRRHAPVGQPPITRWDYPGYIVYFENNRALHAVVPSDPVPVVHQAQLIDGQ